MLKPTDDELEGAALELIREHITTCQMIDADPEIVTTPAKRAAAMLRACKGDALALLRAEHAEWSARQFGDVSAVGPAKHLSKEALEVAAEPLDAIEHADCWMLLWDMQRRAGISDAQLASAIAKKLAINKARSWPAPKEGEAREHKKDPTHDPRPTCKTCGHPAGYCGQC
jgi:hypothetical protein